MATQVEKERSGGEAAAHPVSPLHDQGGFAYSGHSVHARHHGSVRGALGRGEKRVKLG